MTSLLSTPTHLKRVCVCVYFSYSRPELEDGVPGIKECTVVCTFLILKRNVLEYSQTLDAYSRTREMLYDTVTKVSTA